MQLEIKTNQTGVIEKLQFELHLSLTITLSGKGTKILDSVVQA